MIKKEIALTKSPRRAFTAGLSKPVIAALITWVAAFAVFFAGSVSENVVLTFLLVSYIGISLILLGTSLKLYQGDVRKTYIKGFVLSLILIPILVMLLGK